MARFDEEGFENLSPDTQVAVQQLVGNMGQVSTLGMAEAAARGSDADFGAFRAMNDYAGAAGRALTGLNIAQSISEGNETLAFEQAAEWLAGEALSN